MGPENTQGLNPFSVKAELGATAAQKPLPPEKRDFSLGEVINGAGEKNEAFVTGLGRKELDMIKGLGLLEKTTGAGGQLPEGLIESRPDNFSVPVGKAPAVIENNDKKGRIINKIGYPLATVALGTMLAASNPKPAEADNIAAKLAIVAVSAVAGVIIKGFINPTERQAKNTIDHGTRDENLVIQGDANVGKTLMRGQKYEGDTADAHAARQAELDGKYQLHEAVRIDLNTKVENGVMSRKDADEILRNAGYDYPTYYKFTIANQGRLIGTDAAQKAQLAHNLRNDKTSINLQRFQEKANYLKTKNVIEGQGARDIVGETAGAARGGTNVVEDGLNDLFSK